MNTDIVRKLLCYDKSILLWARQTGKTTIIFDYLNIYVQQNQNCDILFFCNKEKLCNDAKNFLFRNYKNVVDQNRKHIKLTNNNRLKFCSIRSEYHNDLLYLKPELIIFDDVSVDIKCLDYLIDFINSNCYRKYDPPCKCLLTGTYINGDLIKSIDCYNDFYINLKKENNQIKNCYSDHNNVSLDINFFSYKPTNLFDADDIRYERKKKLIKINELSKKLKEENGRKM